MDIVLISTSDAGAGRSSALDRMLASVADTAARRPDLSITLLLLLQRCDGDPATSEGFPQFVDVSSFPQKMSLSAARNVLLARARSRGLVGPATVVGFPDDDCWYPPKALDHIAKAFSDPALDFWFCRYSSSPTAVSESDGAADLARVRDVVRHASSNTMFVRGKFIQLGAQFDEAFGVGAPIGGAEDTEFALRADRWSQRTLYLDRAFIGHRDKNPQLRARYYWGGLMAISRHARPQSGIVIELLRKIGVGAWLTLRRELSVRDYCTALMAAYMAWRTGRLDLMPKRVQQVKR